MGSGFKHFTMTVYIPAQVAAAFTREKLEREYAFLDEYIGLDKVYLETHRDACDVDVAQIRMIREFLEAKGVQVSGGITATIPDFEGAVPDKQRLFGTFCYTDPAMRHRIREIAEYTAGLFDEIILDDFFFTSCTCESCTAAKGDLDWVTFRRKLMQDVSENLVVKPAKAVNPKVRMVIKYPNWRESYHFAGYVPEVQRDIFDATYTGTETRSPAYTDQHLPEYLSYSLVRYMENAWPGRNGGGWFDTYECWSIDRYLEQACLTAFAKAGELMHFQWADLIDNPFVTALKLQIGKIDAMLENTGKPCGVPVYIPFASFGENHLEMRLGMLGIPVEPVPFFPVDADRVLLTESSLADPRIVEKLRAYLTDGGSAVITSGFLREAGDALREAGLTEAKITGRTFAATRFHVTGDRGGYSENGSPVLFPEMVHANNDSWSLVNGGDSDLHASLLLRSSCGKGKLYCFVVPEHETDLYRMPEAVLEPVKRILTGGTYASGSGVSAFTYEDGSILLYKYVKGSVHPANVMVHTAKPASFLVDAATGEKIPVRLVEYTQDFCTGADYAATVLLSPGQFRKFTWEACK